jgi:phosphonate transport system permease protein
MTTFNASDLEEIAARHSALLHRTVWQRFRFLIISSLAILYIVYCFWFFSIMQVLGNANWGLAGAYLADWVSYEVRPDIKIAPDLSMQIVYPAYSPLGAHPHPDWLRADRKTVTRTVQIEATPAAPAADQQSNSFMASPMGASSDATVAIEAHTETVTEEVVTRAVVDMSAPEQVLVEPGQLTLLKGNEKLVIPIGAAEIVTLPQPTPSWITQKRAGGIILASYGSAGWVEVDNDKVKIRKRFFGWANFLYDTDSVFFDTSWSQYFRMILSEQRLNPKKSNLQVAIDDILYNPSWQHLDVWTKLLQTIVMAFVGTLLATLVAFPLSFLAARNLTNSKIVNQVTKRFFDFQRSVDMLIWALFFTRGFGPGPLAGISAIFFTDTGTLGKLYSEALENIDNKQLEGIKSVGASPLAVRRFGVLPQVLPVFASQALYFWESNTRSATIIGAVGAGGIGLKLWEAMRTNSNWENVAYMVLLILMVVSIFDFVSNALRSRLIGTQVR